jgi:hypothetical protein
VAEIIITIPQAPPVQINIPVGAPGAPGADGQAQLAAHEANANAHPQYLQSGQAFAEFDTQAKRAQARENLELNYIDGGTF